MPYATMCTHTRLRVEERQYASDVLRLLVRVRADDLADELEDDELQDIAPRGHLVEVLREVEDGALLGRVEEHEEGVALARDVCLGLEHLVRVRVRVKSQGRAGAGPGPGTRDQDRGQPRGAAHLLDERGPIRQQLLEALIDGEAREHSVAAHERVAVLEVVLDGGDERLEDLRLLELAQEAQRAPCGPESSVLAMQCAAVRCSALQCAAVCV